MCYRLTGVYHNLSHFVCGYVCVIFFSMGVVHMYVYMYFQEEKSLWLDQISSYISVG